MAENTGMFAYAHRSREHSIYWIIDLDSGYAELFTDAPDEPACDRGRIISGDLNNGLIVLFQSGGFDWSYQLRFRENDCSDGLIMRYAGGLECEFHAIPISSVLSIRNISTHLFTKET